MQVNYCVTTPGCPGPSFNVTGGPEGMAQWRCTMCAGTVYIETNAHPSPPKTGLEAEIDRTKAIDSISAYSALAIRTLANDVRENETLSTMNAATGLSSETGEINEIIKKRYFHGHPHDQASIDHMEKELGDLAWYWMLMCHCYNLDPARVLFKNIEKLKKRYPEGFSTERSINRAPGDI